MRWTEAWIGEPVVEYSAISPLLNLQFTHKRIEVYSRYLKADEPKRHCCYEPTGSLQ